MRMTVVALVAACVAACANEVTAPTVQPAPENSLSTTGQGPWGFGRRGVGMGSGILFATRRLPANLQLTDAQRTRIKSLMTAYRAAHEDDLKSLAAVGKQAHAARASGQRLTADQRRALFAQTAPARQRLMAANKEIGAQIQNILTSDQKAWLASHHPTFRRARSARRSA